MANLTQALNPFTQIAPCKVVATSNQIGTYNNGPIQNGVGSTFTYTATGLVTIDGVTISVKDRILFSNQALPLQNGIYECVVSGIIGNSAVFQRSGDFQCSEQISAGHSVPITSGVSNNGVTFVVVDPRPGIIGIDNIIFVPSLPGVLGTASSKAASDNTKASVASVSGATILGNVATFADTAGTVKDGSFSVRAQAVTNAGGITFTVTDPFITTGTILTGMYKSQTNSPSVPITMLPSNGSFLVTNNIDPGACTFFYIAIKPAV